MRASVLLVCAVSVVEAVFKKKDAVTGSEPPLMALIQDAPVSHAAAFLVGCVFTLLAVGIMNIKLLDSDPYCFNEPMGECEANSVHLSKRKHLMKQS